MLYPPRLEVLLLIIFAAGAHAGVEPCKSIGRRQTVQVALSPSHSGCVSLAVEPGEPVQLRASQPRDIGLQVTGSGTAFRIDSFEFGDETVALTEPGRYRIDIYPVDAANSALVTIDVTREALPLPQAQLWREAEANATVAKEAHKEDALRAAMVRWEALGYRPGVARTQILLGDTMYGAGEMAKARAEYEGALAGCIALRELRCAGEAANNSGQTAQYLGEFDAARERLEQAAEFLRQLHDAASEAVVLSNLGLLHQSVGEFDVAIRQLGRAELVLRGRDAINHARVLNRLGLSYLSLVEPGRARVYFERALAEFRAAKSQGDAIRARANLGRSYMLEDRLELAQSTLEAVLANPATPPDRRVRAGVLTNLGQVLLKLRDYPAAEEKLTQALVLDEETGDRRSAAFELYHLGSAALGLGKTALARELLGRSLAIREDSGLREEAGDALLALAELEFGAGDLAAAHGFAGRSLAYLESARASAPGASLQASFNARKRKLFDVMVDIAMASGGDAAAANGLLAAEQGRARALLDLLAEGSLLRNVPAGLRERRAAIQRRIDLLSMQIVKASEAQRGGLRERVQTLLAQDEELEAEIRAAVTGQRLGQPLRSMAELQAALEPGSALLEYHLGERQSYAWLIDRERVRAFRLPARTAIEMQSKAVVDWLGRIQERRRSPAHQQRFDAAVGKLSATLLGPVTAERLPDKLILALDGVLHRVPFTALRTTARGPCLGMKHDLIEVPSAGYLITGRAPRPWETFPRTFLAVVDPVFSAGDARLGADRKDTSAANDGALARLPFNGEVDTIAALVPPGRRRVLRGFDANRQALATLRLEDYAIVHFSTHARIDDRIPELSRIALSTVDRNGKATDGFLRPYQLARLRLNGSVAVLSACDTALGKQVMGEGLAGFTSSLFTAGAAQLVLTLTEVDAEASSEFLSGVYRRIVQQHVTMERAMTLTRRTMAASERWSDPYYWSSFVTIGRPSPARR